MPTEALEQTAARLLTPDLGVELAQAAAGDLGPALVLLIVDQDGLLVAVRSDEVALAEVPAAYESLLRLLAAPQGRGPTLVASLLPDADPADLVAAWPSLRERIAAAGARPVDWLLVTEAGTIAAAGLALD